MTQGRPSQRKSCAGGHGRRTSACRRRGSTSSSVASAGSSAPWSAEARNVEGILSEHSVAATRRRSPIGAFTLRRGRGSYAQPTPSSSQDFSLVCFGAQC